MVSEMRDTTEEVHNATVRKTVNGESDGPYNPYFYSRGRNFYQEKQHQKQSGLACLSPDAVDAQIGKQAI